MVKVLRSGYLILLGLSTFVLSACGESGPARAQKWMEAASQNLTGVQSAPSQPQAFAVFRYSEAGRVDPFSDEKLLARGQSIRAADLPPHSEVLEQYPLETLHYVGFVRKNGNVEALVKNDAGAVFHTSAGHFMGRDYGRIVSVSDASIELEEMVHDASGDWVARRSKLALIDAGV